MTGRRAAAALRGLAAMITLLVLVIGLPAVLYRFGGNPVPPRLPSLHQVSHTLLQRDSGAGASPLGAGGRRRDHPTSC